MELQIPKHEDMIKAGMHFGRKKSIFHPRMKPFVYTLKENICIIDLIKTSDSLVKAIDFLKKEKEAGKVILFVGTTKQSVDVTKATAEALNMPYITNRWLGGTLTNFKTIMSRVRYLESLEAQKAQNDFEGFTKKEKLLKEREIEALRAKFDGIRKLAKIPDVLVVTSLKNSLLAVKEAQRMNVKIVGIVNTDSNPEDLDYAIPANDNSKKSVEIVLDAIKNSLV